MSHYQEQLNKWDEEKERFPPHADVRKICDELWRLENHFEKMGLLAPWLTKARDMLIRMSVHVDFLEKNFKEQTEKGKKDG